MKRTVISIAVIIIFSLTFKISGLQAQNQNGISLKKFHEKTSTFQSEPSYPQRQIFTKFSSSENTFPIKKIHFDDSNWDNSIPGTNGRIMAVACSGDYIWIGGLFTMAGTVPCNNIARWSLNTSTWEPLGTGTDGIVNSILLGESGSGIYSGGEFITAGGTTVNNVAY
jgi:hypothetical protein